MIATNMDVAASTAVVDGYQAVFEAVQQSLTGLGIMCDEIGALPEADVDGCSCEIPYDGDQNGIVNVDDVLNVLSYFNVQGC